MSISAMIAGVVDGLAEAVRQVRVLWDYACEGAEWLVS